MDWFSICLRTCFVLHGEGEGPSVYIRQPSLVGICSRVFHCLDSPARIAELCSSGEEKVEMAKTCGHCGYMHTNDDAANCAICNSPIDEAAGCNVPGTGYPGGRHFIAAKRVKSTVKHPRQQYTPARLFLQQPRLRPTAPSKHARRTDQPRGTVR